MNENEPKRVYFESEGLKEVMNDNAVYTSLKDVVNHIRPYVMCQKKSPMLMAHNFIFAIDLLDNVIDLIKSTEYTNERICDEAGLIGYGIVCQISNHFIEILKFIDSDASIDISPLLKFHMYQMFECVYISCIDNIILDYIEYSKSEEATPTKVLQLSFILELLSPLASSVSGQFYFYYTPDSMNKFPVVNKLGIYPNWSDNSCYADALMTALFYENRCFDNFFKLSNNKFDIYDTAISYTYVNNLLSRDSTDINGYIKKMFPHLCKQKLEYQNTERSHLLVPIYQVISSFITVASGMKSELERGTYITMDEINTNMRKIKGQPNDDTRGDPYEFLQEISSIYSVKNLFYIPQRKFTLRRQSKEIQFTNYIENECSYDHTSYKFSTESVNFLPLTELFDKAMTEFIEVFGFTLPSYYEIKYMDTDRTSIPQATNQNDELDLKSPKTFNLPPIIYINVAGLADSQGSENRIFINLVQDIIPDSKKKLKPFIVQTKDGIGRIYTYALNSIIYYTSDHYYSCVFSQGKWYNTNVSSESKAPKSMNFSDLINLLVIRKSGNQSLSALIFKRIV